MELENPQKIMIDIKKRPAFSFTTWLRHLSLSEDEDIMMNDSTFDEKFSVKGNESVIRAILDPSICSKIMKIRDFNVIIGVDKIKDSFAKSSIDPNSLELAYHLQIQLMSHIRKGLESKYETNVAQYVDFQSLNMTKQDANRFRAIIDAMIDIVEKIDAYSFYIKQFI